MKPELRARRAFNHWYSSTMANADGGFDHLPRWHKADLWSAWQAAAEQSLSHHPSIDEGLPNDWTVDDSETAREILNYLGIGSDASLEPGDRRRDKVAKMIRARIDKALPTPPHPSQVGGR